jgi:hypothetical protein
MKKQVIFFYSILICLVSSGQKLFRKTDQPCNEKMTDTIRGRWVKGPDILNPEHIGLNKTQVQEVINRLNAIHKLSLETYPNLIGVDAGWHHTLSYATFANEVKYQVNENGILNTDPVKENPVALFYYQAAFFKYFCLVSKQNEIWSGLNGETSTTLKVSANNLSNFLNPTEYKEVDATIDGRPIQLRKSIIGKWKGYDLYSEGGLGMENYKSRFVLIHRNGELPYIPVTRKQYLDQCISHVKIFYDKMWDELNQIPDPKLRSEQKENIDNQKRVH